MPSQSQNFWNFSVEFYARDRVAGTCLDLQNSYGIDVNMLLLCYWHGLYHGVFPASTLQQSLELSLQWKQEVVQPLRNVRQWMKQQASRFAHSDLAQFETLRSRIKFDELAAEKYQQELLEQLALANAEHSEIPGESEACEKNIENYFAAIGLELDDMMAMKLKIITKALSSQN